MTILSTPSPDLNCCHNYFFELRLIIYFIQKIWYILVWFNLSLKIEIWIIILYIRINILNKMNGQT
jgi:hypothetical protein